MAIEAKREATRPGTFEELLAVLSTDASRLPPRLRQVAAHLTQHPDDAALSTVSALAAAMGVQPSTLVRFAQLLGFSGWSELQAVFKAHLRGSPRRDGALPPRLAGLAAAADASLARLPETLDASAFDRAADALAQAPLVTLIGAKRAFPVAAYLSLTLTQHGMRTALLHDLGGGAEGDAGLLGPADCVLAISFSPYNSSTPALVRLARERGARVVAITDGPLSPLVALAEASLVVVEKADAGYRTLAATVTVALALAVEAAERRLRR